jgi:hypothetical protein
MKKLIREHRPDGLPETDAIVEGLKRAMSSCRDRNLLDPSIADHRKVIAAPPPPMEVAIHAFQSKI